MHQHFDQRSGRAGGQVDNRMSLRVPAGGSVKAPSSVKRAVITDSPEEHVGERPLASGLRNAPNCFWEGHDSKQ